MKIIQITVFACILQACSPPILYTADSIITDIMGGGNRQKSYFFFNIAYIFT